MSGFILSTVRIYSEPNSRIFIFKQICETYGINGNTYGDNWYVKAFFESRDFLIYWVFSVPNHFVFTYLLHGCKHSKLPPQNQHKSTEHMSKRPLNEYLIEHLTIKLVKVMIAAILLEEDPPEDESEVQWR